VQVPLAEGGQAWVARMSPSILDKEVGGLKVECRGISQAQTALLLGCCRTSISSVADHSHDEEAAFGMHASLRSKVSQLRKAGTLGKVAMSKVAEIHDTRASNIMQTDLAGRTVSQIECAFFVFVGDEQEEKVPGLYQAVTTLDGALFVDLRHLEEADAKVVTGHAVRSDKQQMRGLQPVLEKVDKFQEVFAVQVSCGLFHMLVVTSEGHLYSIGLNDRGQLGVTQSSQLRWHLVCINSLAKSISLPLGAKVVQVSCGAKHSVAVVDNGLVYAWGANDKYQIGHQHGNDVFDPTLVASFFRPSNQWENLAKTQAKGGSHVQKFELEAIELPWIVNVSCGELHTAMLSAKGQVSLPLRGALCAACLSLYLPPSLCVFRWGFGRSARDG
jgi:hypothetical protein